MLRVFPLLPLFLISANASAEFSHFPSAINNRWTMGNGYTGPAQLTISESKQLANDQQLTLSLKTPFWNVDYLFVVLADGLYLEGFKLGDSSVRFPAPAPFFPATMAAGQRLATIFGSVTLVNSQVSILDRSGRNQLCRHYRIEWQSGGKEDWYLAPGVGPVQYLDGPGAFVLESATISPYVAPPVQYKASPCAPFGVMVNPVATESYSTAKIQSGLADISGLGGSVLAWDARWADLEPSRGVYDLAEMQRQIDYAASMNMNMLFTIRVVDTVALTLPGYLNGRRMDDPLVTTRFQELIRRVAPLFAGRVRWVNLSNEIDAYLTTYPTEVEGYRALFNAGYDTLKSVNPSVSIGSVHSFQALRGNDAVFRAVGSLGDHVGLSYYPVDAAYQVIPLSQVSRDFAEVLAMAGNRPVILTEIGFPSSVANGSSLSQQAAFYAALLAEVQNAGARIGALNFFFVNDFAEDVVAPWLPYYNQSGNSTFLNFLTSLGMFDANGKAKPSWTTFSEKMTQIRTAGCREPLP